MRLADRLLQKMNDGENGRESLHFVRAEEGARQFLSCNRAGKPFVIADTENYKKLARFAVNANALSLVYDGDALALFSMPDGVGSVFCVGGEDVLRAARYFSLVRRVPCALFPSSGTLYGAYESTGEITLCGQQKKVPLAEGEVYFDLDGGFSLSEAYAQVYLCALARFEERALADFGVAGCVERSEIKLEAFPDRADLVALNARLRREESCGAPAGEGKVLADLYRKDKNKRPVFRAFTELMALYYAFFKCGIPRKYYIPDYAARAKAVGAEYCNLKIPTPQEYAMRAFALEKMRSLKLSELKTILESWQKSRFCIRQSASLVNLEFLKYLPEYGGGLTAIIRDFGLLG